ncbi:MAG: hypothetical protein HYT76_05050 [Deltaproteobacteria bacterium]|nr:hypothetical protein [Deltaproteobacteria bacterium]
MPNLRIGALVVAVLGAACAGADAVTRNTTAVPKDAPPSPLPQNNNLLRGIRFAHTLFSSIFRGYRTGTEKVKTDIENGVCANDPQCLGELLTGYLLMTKCLAEDLNPANNPEDLIASLHETSRICGETAVQTAAILNSRNFLDGAKTVYDAYERAISELGPTITKTTEECHENENCLDETAEGMEKHITCFTDEMTRPSQTPPSPEEGNITAALDARIAEVDRLIEISARCEQTLISPSH